MSPIAKSETLFVTEKIVDSGGNAMYPPKIENTKMQLVRTNVDGGNDIVYLEGRLYIISAADGGSLRVCSADKGEVHVLGEVGGLGNMRQIEVSAEAAPGRIIAAVTARECGLYLIDVTDPTRPYVCCHYDTVEFGTGVAFSGHYAAVGCRSFGVEIIDVQIPEKPRHVSVIRAGEVQSVCIDNGVLYTGSWGERQVNVFEIKDAAKPVKLATIPLEGKGDGLTVRDGLLYAATGQHLRPADGSDPEAYGFGRGNGFVIWDVHDPANPVKVSATMLPVRYHCAFWDMWDVTLCGKYAVVSNTLIGVWIYDVSDPAAPVLMDHAAITTEHRASEFIPMFAPTRVLLPFEHEKQMYAPVTGVAAADGRLYIAARFQNIHVAFADYFVEEKEEKTCISEDDDYYVRYAGDECRNVRIIRTEGQAHAAASYGGYTYVACGMGGIQIFDVNFERVSAVTTSGFALDIRERCGLLYVAAGREGVIVYRPKGAEEVARISLGGATCAQVVPSADGRFVMAHTDDQHLSIIDFSDMVSPSVIMSEHYVPGLIYHRHISHEGVCGRYFGCYWNNNVTHWYDLSGEKPLLTEFAQGRLSFGDGITGLSRPYTTLAVVNGGYVLCDIRSEKAYGDYDVIRVEGAYLRGKPVIDGDRLYVCDKLNGNVVMCDISDIYSPRLVRRYNFSGHPDLVCPVDGGAVVPLGHQGIAYIKC